MQSELEEHEQSRGIFQAGLWWFSCLWFFVLFGLLKDEKTRQVRGFLFGSFEAPPFRSVFSPSTSDDADFYDFRENLSKDGFRLFIQQTKGSQFVLEL